MQKYVRVIAGKYRNMEITNMLFPLVKDHQDGARGMFVTVDATGIIAGYDRIRVTVDSRECLVYEDGQGNTVDVSSDFVEVSQHQMTELSQAIAKETDEEAMNRIRNQFAVLDLMTDAVAKGQVRGVIVSGPPGVGKSWGVQTVLSHYDLQSQLAGGNPVSEFVSGGVSDLGLYKTLYNNSSKGNIVVFDDCDSVLFDEDMLNMLKNVLDTGKRRQVSWRKESRVLENDGIPNTFDFEGGVIFITNVNFANVRSKKIKDHLAALMSRCHYIDLGIYGDRDKFLRINQIIKDGLLEKYNFGDDGDQELVDFLVENSQKLNELSLRTVIKLADLRLISSSNWKSIAETTLMKSWRAMVAQ